VSKFRENIPKWVEPEPFAGFLQIFSKKVWEKFGGKEKVRIFAARLRNNGTVH